MTAPELRTLTHEQLKDEAARRFGQNNRMWAFRCPNCGDVASCVDFYANTIGTNRLGTECIGRHVSGRGCERSAYGLVEGPWQVEMPDGSTILSFPLATTEQANRAGVFCTHPSNQRHNPNTCPTNHRRRQAAAQQ